MKHCPTCNAEVHNSHHIFCNSKCYYARKNYNKHSQETKDKIAAGNSKPFSEERKRAISIAKTFVPSQELLEKLQELWALTYVSPVVIAKLTGLDKRPSVYKRLCKTHCTTKQLKFMSPDWYPQHYELLFELGKQNLYYKDIAKCLGFGEKQTYEVALKLGLKLNRRNPNAYMCVISKPEKTVLDWLRNAGYEIETQFQLGNFYFDGHIKGTNILIEVHGDYWHCNPKVYVNGAINEMQKAHQRRDFAKKALVKQMGFYQITIWELDIKQNPEKTSTWLLKKVKENVRDNDSTTF